MKYILFTVIGLAIVFGICFFASGLIRRKMKKKLPFILHILISIVSGLLVLTIAAGVYLNIHYSADNEAAAVFANSRNIKVNELDNAFFIDGEGENTAFIFYPGAKVDSDAYSPLMKQLAANRVDTSVHKLTFRTAICVVNASDPLITD